MQLVIIIFQFVGSLAFLLYGMKLMSDGVQKSAGNSLHKILGLVTGNQFFAILTGLLATMIIQSSGATTVMVVSFVNAGLMTLAQSIGVIFGANIGTTITAWIVALFGFKFDISALAIPLFGIGFLLRTNKKFNRPNIGEAIMGFGLLFLGLDLLKDALNLDASQVSWLTYFNDKGAFGLFVGLIVGIIITALIHSSSASTAIFLTMCHSGLISWEMAAVMTLGSSIGSTIDAIMAAWGTKENAERAALVHVIFNVVGVALALIFFQPLLTLIDIIVPGPIYGNEPLHIAMLHTVFKILNTLVFLPFTKQLEKLCGKIIKDKPDDESKVYKLEPIYTGAKENAEAYIFRAEKEIEKLADLAYYMVQKLRHAFDDNTEEFVKEYLRDMSEKEDYADQMQEQLSAYLIQCSQLSVTKETKNNISIMIRIIDEIENMTDDCYSIALLIKRNFEKKLSINKDDIEKLEPYETLVKEFMIFIKENLNKHLSKENLRLAETIEDQIDDFRAKLKKVARHRLEEGADVRSELLYIDIVRHIEKIGDRAFAISEALAQTI